MNSSVLDQLLFVNFIYEYIFIYVSVYTTIVENLLKTFDKSIVSRLKGLRKLYFVPEYQLGMRF